MEQMKENLLDKINNPQDIKKLNIDQLQDLCKDIRHYMLECCANNPGHLGASLGAVETAVALHYVYDTPKDKLVWDVGHQAYAHKIITGRKEEFKNNRKYKGLSGFTKRAESIYDPFGAGHTSTSISGALGIAEAAKIKGEDTHAVAIIGDGALSGGLSFEALNNAGALKSNILVIVNDNQISIDKNVGAMHNYLVKISTSRTYNKLKENIWGQLDNRNSKRKLRSLIQKFMYSTKLAFFKSGSIFESLGFRYFGTVDGNNIIEMVTTLSNIKNIKGPKILHIRTIKGKGYKPAEENQSIWHAPGKFDINTGERIKSGKDVDRYQDVFGDTIVELAQNNPKIVAITPAMASGCSMNKMMNIFPNRSYDVGIAEQHAVTFSAGLASEGILPYCNIYSSFMQRAFDNIIHDVAIQNLKVIFCIDRGGLVGEDGATHHGAYDLAYLRFIPNITIMAPMNEVELRNAMYSASLPEYGITSIRYPRGGTEGLDWKQKFEKIEIGKGRILRKGEKISVLSLGTIGNKAAKAIQIASEEGINISHYDMRFLKPLDTSIIDQACENSSIIITIEDGSLIGGLNSAVAEYISKRQIGVKLIGLGIPDEFVEQGSINELMGECGYDTKDIYKIIKNNF